ncbi:hypothetical protein [Amycolatopsis sp. NPDC004079]|uniref:hypothetical protein n=1 Tax=Amycolatopsis sp. NPDC004079 TaxID=3154549 RepID=UPI00339FE1C9
MSMDEETAFAIVHRVLGAQVDPYGAGGRQHAADALLHFPDGREGALKVGSLGPPAEAAITAILAKDGWTPRTVQGLRRTWIATLPRDSSPAQPAELDDLLLECERHGVASLDQLYRLALSGKATRDVLAWADAGASAVAVEDSDQRPSQAWVMPGGATGNGAELLPAELDAALASPILQSQLAKLNDTGTAERHLFLWIRTEAFPFAVIDTLYFGGALPTGRPILPAGLAQVWLASGHHAGGVVRAIAHDRWARDHPYD